MEKHQKQDIDNILLHLAEDRNKYYNAVSPPIIQTSNFVFDSIEHLRESIKDEIDNHIYTRGNNPTVEILRRKIAALEKAEDALIVGSGSSAMSIAVLTNVNAGDHIVCINHPYSWTKKLTNTMLPRFGITTTYVDGSSLDEITAAIQENTKVIILESPNSITYELQDLKAVSDLAKENNIVTVIDNSYSSPIFQNPITLGIDIVIHSGTKYLNGHSDVVCGMICSSTEMIKKIFANEYMTLGTIISPSDAMLIIRGLRTLEIRMKRIEDTTTKLVNYLHTHPKVRQVLYPFHESFPQQALAKKQMSGCSGLFSIILDTDDKETVMRFSKALDRFLIAVSWGGHESLQMPFLAFHDMEGKEDHHVDWRLVRLSVGFESYKYLKENLDKALEVV